MQTCNFGDTYSQGSLFFILLCHFLSSPRKTKKPITGLFLLFNHTKPNCRNASESSTHCHCWIPQIKLLKIWQSRPPSPGQRKPPSVTAQNFVFLDCLVDPWLSCQSSHKILTLLASHSHWIPPCKIAQICAFQIILWVLDCLVKAVTAKPSPLYVGHMKISKHENETVSE